MKRKLIAYMLIVCMLFTLVPVSAFAATLEQLPTPEIHWLTEDTAFEDAHYFEGTLLLNNVPLNILPDYSIKIVDVDGNIVEAYNGGFDGSTLYSRSVLRYGWFVEKGLKSGKYKAQVQYLGDGEKYSDSIIAETPEYLYIRPNKQYTTPTGIQWMNGDLSIDNVDVGNRLIIEFQYSNGNITHAMDYGYYWDNNTKPYLDYFYEIVNRYGSGDYRFRARVKSEDMKEIYHSDWSEWSDVYTVTGDTVLSTLENLNAKENLSADDAIAAVKELNTNELMTALSADNKTTGVAKELSELEEKIDLTAEVELEADTGFTVDTSKVSIIGAGLNAKDTSIAPVFTISKPDTKYTLPDGYANDVWMDFSLSNIEKNEDGTLAVPIRITMPVPDGLNAEKLCIFHYKDDDSFEKIEPYVYQDGNIYLASFTVNSLSPFAFAQAASTVNDLIWLDKATGTISWPEVKGYTFYDVVVKCDGKRLGNKQYRGPATNGTCTMSVAEFVNDSGNYTFSVAALADDQQPGNGANYVQSKDVFNYQRPAVSLATPQAVMWRDKTASWSPVIPGGDVARYKVRYHKGNDTSSGAGLEYNAAPRSDGYIYETTGTFLDRYLDLNNQNVEYKFTVRAVSKNILAIANSDMVLSDNAVTASDFTGKLSSPTGLEWCRDNRGSITGNIAFYPVVNQGDTYNVQLIRDGKIVSSNFHSYFFDERSGKNIIEMSNWIIDEGSYEVAIRAIGDGKITFDSAFTKCDEIFTYKRPVPELGIPTEIHWNQDIASWKGVDGASSYLVDYYLNGKWNGSIHNAKNKIPSTGYFIENSGSFVRKIINYNGDGEYTFTVRAISNEIHNVAHGKPSSFSGVLDLDAIAKNVIAQLDVMIAKLKTGENAEIPRGEAMRFAVAMATDSDVREKMKEYEKLYQTHKNVDVKVNVAADVAIANQLLNKVTVDGAALNSVDNGEVILNVSAGTEKNINTQLYTDCVFVEMNLENGTQNGTLKVPVRITMPVPANINPDRFRIIHYFNDGSSEVIYPVLNADKTMASYVLTHFSTFAFVEEVVNSGNDDKPLNNPVEEDKSEQETPKPPATSSGSGSGFSGTYNYAATVNAVEGCEVSLSKDHAVAGEEVSISVTPDKGKEIKDVIITDVNGNVIPVTKTADNQYSFVMPSGKVKIEVKAEDADYSNKVVLQIGKTTVKANDNTFQNDVAPVLIGDRTVVPIRIIVEALGGNASWDEASRTVTLTIDGKVLKLVIDQEIPGFGTGAVIMNSRTYVPVRYVAEYVGAEVEWIQASEQIIIKK